jgi:two-component system NtrC family response regulator
MSRILVVDDDKALRDALSEAVRDLGYEPLVASCGSDALTQAHAKRPDAILLDLRMPDISGLDVLRRLREQSSGAPPVAILTAYATAANTVEAMRLGAFDHLTKPVGRDDLASLLRRMIRSRATAAAKPPKTEETAAEELIGASSPMREVQKTVGLVADSDTTVLITGETGTGKEVVARTIHRAGFRSKGPFVALNCAAIPAELLESELFGHARGAFTGAVAERKGAFRDADGGTLFLDEIGDMELAMQAKILRAIQERVVTPVGGRPQRIDARIIAATHRDLADWVRRGRFREDLFYRLNVVPIALHPLRARGDDIVPLVRHFLKLASQRPMRLSDRAAERLSSYAWPGNVRELRNAMERVAVFCRGDVIDAEDLDFLGSHEPKMAAISTAADLPSAVEDLERKMIAEALSQSRGNRAEVVWVSIVSCCTPSSRSTGLATPEGPLRRDRRAEAERPDSRRSVREGGGPHADIISKTQLIQRQARWHASCDEVVRTNTNTRGVFSCTGSIPTICRKSSARWTCFCSTGTAKPTASS